MGKKSLVYLLIVLLLLTCFSLYNKHVKESTSLSKSINILKIDFIAFPIKENQAKLFPLVKQFTSSLPKSKTEENKEESEQLKSIEKTPEIKKPLPEKTVVVKVPDVVLKIGDNGDAVKYIQHKLNEYGYKLEEDGLFSALTYDSILNFQYRCNLGIDGAVGPKTLEKLNIPPDKNIGFNTKIASVSSSKNTTSTIALNNYKSVSELESSINSPKATSKTNYYIKVDLSNQRVNIFTKSEDKWVLDKSFICSTGKASTPTVKGDFTIKDKGPMFRAGSNTICNYYTQFYGNYLFHTVLLDNNENIQDGRLGTPLSHGCIRLAIDDAKYIYTSIPYGTSVSIQ
ncbi:L,D-transpeptidase family protein [Clostridium sp. CS001]|uniref:L,D-transpeptidase family protein n=1 Tax=Clostridium sp. CS001 TaxID=2880648 RepID=UPI001CF19C5D|nr:L,D-transpeptidase family protein [Clostridium sp. CS001]MCB2290248.1 L,D-transpeptidase family protein [Clostridium sp. CS001]